jgi:hypothetical protein
LDALVVDEAVSRDIEDGGAIRVRGGDLQLDTRTSE